MKLDVLAFAAHPDDAELGCGGSLILLAQKGLQTGVVDITRGELGTRGSAELRDQEAAAASQLLGLSYRANLSLRDGWFTVDESSLKAVIAHIRLTQPRLVLLNAPEDRHPDHPKAHKLVREAIFLSGLPKVVVPGPDGSPLPAHRPDFWLAYIQDRWLQPSVVQDITPVFAQKMESLKAYSSQFYNPNASEQLTLISTDKYPRFLEGRAREMGHFIGVEFGEGFWNPNPLPMELLWLLQRPQVLV